MKKIIVVAESIDVEDSSGSKANVALILSLRKANFDVEVYHYTRKEIELNDIKCIDIKENRGSLLFFLSRTERFLRNNLNIDIHTRLEKIFGFSFTLFNDRNSIVSSLHSIEKDRVDLILTLSKGGSFRPHHALLKMPDWYSKWMAYFHDPYPMHLYPRPYAWVEPGYMAKWKFVKNVSQKARFSAFPSKLLMEWMGSYFKDFLKSGVIIPHQTQEINTIIKNDPTEEKIFSVVHAGNLLHARDPKGLVEGFKLFLSRNPKARDHSFLWFIGATEYFDHYLKNESAENSFIKFISQNQSLSEVDRLQRTAAVNVILEAKSEISPFLPGKFSFCVVANRPILLLGPYYSESRRLLGEDYLYWTEIDNVNRIADLVEALYERWLENTDCDLNREDLVYYLSEDYLKHTVEECL